MKMRWRLFWLQRQIAKKRKQVSIRWICEQYFELLDPELFSNYFPVQGASVSVEAYYSSLSIYTAKMKTWTKGLRNESLHADSVDTSTARSVTIDQLISVEGDHYVDVKVSLNSFRKAGIALCAIAEPGDSADYGAFEYAERILRKTFLNIETILVSLIKVSLTKPR